MFLLLRTCAVISIVVQAFLFYEVLFGMRPANLLRVAQVRFERKAAESRNPFSHMTRGDGRTLGVGGITRKNGNVSTLLIGSMARWYLMRKMPATQPCRALTLRPLNVVGSGW